MKVQPVVGRINRLIALLDVDRYLEIGVFRGETLFNVRAKEKTAVDPSFQFDLAAARLDHVETCFYEEESDKFFSELSLQTNYDLIFLDGLHEFEQTYRDLCNSLVHSHKKTVFIIDDIRPVDVFSALKKQTIAQKRREEETGRRSGAWHGDVFKVLFALHDFHPSLRYCTIKGAGNPQALVWYSKKTYRKPIFNSFEHISRLSYFDLLDNLSVLNECSEEDAIARCIDDLS